MNFNFYQDNYLNPTVDSTYITHYYKSPFVKDSDGTETKKIIQIIKNEGLIDPEFEQIVKEGLEKTFNIAKFGLNVFSKEIQELKKELDDQQKVEMKKSCTFSSLCLTVMTISSLALTGFIAFGMFWLASFVISIPRPFSLVQITAGSILSITTYFVLDHFKKNDLIKKSVEKAAKEYPDVLAAIENFDHDAIVVLTVLDKMSKLIDNSKRGAGSELSAKIFKIQQHIISQFHLRKTIKNVCHTFFKAYR